MTALYFRILFFSSVAFGAITGAYFGTAEYRIRHHLPLATSECYCPQCGHVLSIQHQIPIVSWLFLRGACAYCHAPISVRYPLIEGGFLLYYGAIFLLLNDQLFLMLLLWYIFLCLLLILRCRFHFSGLLRGLLIFTVYHLIYGGLLTVIYAALDLI